MRTIGLVALVIFSVPVFAHAAVVIDEIMYNPAGSGGAQWIELYNSGAAPVTMIAGNKSGAWHTDDGSSSKHYLVDPASGGRGSLVIPAGGFTIITNDPSGFIAKYSGAYSVVKSALSLKTASGTVAVYDESGVMVGVSVSYDKTMGGYNDDNSLQLVNGNLVAATPTPGVANDSGSSEPTPPDDSSDSTSTTDTTISSSGGPAEYLPIPTLQILTAGTRTVSSGADTVFSASVYDSRGNKRDDAVVTWSFGDGMRKVGASVFHQYYSSGEYLAVVRATTGDGGNVQKEVVVTVKDASIKISLVSSRGITLANSDSRTLDLSLWRLSMGGQEFKIPEDTQILAGRTILFPSQVIELPVTDTASLLYPSGEIADTYGAVVPVSAVVQPSPSVVSYEQVQKVESIISQREIVPVHEEAVGAPTAVNELAAVGATLSPEPAMTSRFAGIFKSPWTIGFIGTMLLAGGAFILL